jgi:hypothetical protein
MAENISTSILNASDPSTAMKNCDIVGGYVDILCSFYETARAPMIVNGMIFSLLNRIIRKVRHLSLNNTEPLP